MAEYVGFGDDVKVTLRLIAGADDLVNALIGLVEICDAHDDKMRDSPNERVARWDAARTAIRNALPPKVYLAWRASLLVGEGRGHRDSAKLERHIVTEHYKTRSPELKRQVECEELEATRARMLKIETLHAKPETQ